MIGKQAVVIGAGIGGLTAAGALADHFERVIVLEKDALPQEAADRVGVPQGKHVHALLAGGQRALDELFPGFERALVKGGAVSIRVGLDIRMERPGFDPFPQRDIGFDCYAMSRALVEFTVRQQVHALANVEIRQRTRVEGLVARPDTVSVSGVQWAPEGGTSEMLEADFVVDASGRGAPTLSLIESIGLARPEEATVGVDLAYASAIFAIPDDATSDWKGVFTFPGPRSSRGSLMLPLEGRRWIVTVAGRHGERPPGDLDGFMTFVKGLRTPTISNAIAHAKLLGEVVRFGFPESTWRHYERLERFPQGLLPIGDAVCRFNPIYGQGMSVASQEARALRQLLATRATAPDPLDGLAQAFFADAAALIDTPWAGSVIPDFAHPDTRGERPADFEVSIKYGMALSKLAARDPAVHRLTAEVSHLLKPRSVYREPELVQRVLAVMADG
jgi:2-polyprenyl-6-methoxyphenol hydroxylase-like FAD-dependent oxidoreductase